MGWGVNDARKAAKKRERRERKEEMDTKRRARAITKEELQSMKDELSSLQQDPDPRRGATRRVELRRQIQEGEAALAISAAAAAREQHYKQAPDAAYQRLLEAGPTAAVAASRLLTAPSSRTTGLCGFTGNTASDSDSDVPFAPPGILPPPGAPPWWAFPKAVGAPSRGRHRGRHRGRAS